MQTYKQDVITKNNLPRVLLVGTAGNALDDPRQLDILQCRRCENMLDAITVVAQESFDVIFVVMSSFDRGLDDALATLRKLSPHGRIILLSEMGAEYEVRQILRRPGNPKGLVDDYFICPENCRNLWDKSGLTVKKQQKHAEDHYKDLRIKHLEKLATEDDLTGLKNRRYIREFLRQIIERSDKQSLPVTLLIFDIDNFKHYNDTYGHAVGDDVLRQAAVMMQRCCRGHDVVGRIGGDEFAVIFWDCPDGKKQKQETEDIASERRHATEIHPDEVFFMSERFRTQISTADLSLLGPDGKGVLTVSGGLASFPQDGKAAEELFVQADKAMLKAKRSGKNRIYLVGQPE